jgi:hypothetical protein
MTPLALRFKFITTAILCSLLLSIIFISCSKNDSAPPPSDQILSEKLTPSSLMGFWKFDGNANDASGHDNNGIVRQGHAFYGAGTPVLTTDRFGRANRCYHFDKGGNIEVPYSTELNPPKMTISLWCKKDTAGRIWDPATYTMVSLNRWHGYKLQYQSANKIFYTVEAANGTDTVIYDRDDNLAVLDNEVWYHVAVTYKPGEMDFYINGDLIWSWTNTPFPAVTLSTPINFVIGQDLPTDKYLTVDGNYQVAWGGFFTGDLDDVMFFNVALSSQQVKSIYDRQKTL